MAVVGIVVGLVVGAVIGWLLTQRSLGGATTALQVQNALLEERATAATEAVAKLEADIVAVQARADAEKAERQEEYRLALQNLEATFESTSNRVLKQTVNDFSENQAQVLQQRDETLKATLTPLETQLKQYRDMLDAYNCDHVVALTEVRTKAQDLLAAQEDTVKSTSRLNQLLGRSDQRGHWGEIQLANIMDKSGLRPAIDYSLQSSRTNEDGQRKRPDCIVNLPNGTRIVVDAKFPFDAFEKSLDEIDPQERLRLRTEHAKALREHVRTLKRKSYWSDMDFTPAFTVCFLPSDAALAAAFEADGELHAYAVSENVLVVGPTNLLAMLWSAALVLQQFRQTVNAQEILATASQLYDRIAIVANHLQKLGKSLNQTVSNYNNVVGSAEVNMLTTARTLNRLAATRNPEPVSDVPALETPVRSLDERKWGADLSDPELDARAELLDIDALDEVEE